MELLQTTLCYLEKDGAYLMLHRVKKKNDVNHDKWVGVGGKFEPGEDAPACALREVREETGLEVRLQSGFRQMVEYFPKPNVKKQVVYFLGEAKSSRVKKQEEEISRIIWTDIRRAWRIVAFENDKNLIWMAHKRLQ